MARTSLLVEKLATATSVCRLQTPATFVMSYISRPTDIHLSCKFDVAGKNTFHSSRERDALHSIVELCIVVLAILPLKLEEQVLTFQ